MLELLVLDLSAESRNKIRNKITDFMQNTTVGSDVVPRINIKPISLPELRFQVSSQLIIVGSEAIAKDMSVIADIKKTFPQMPIIAWLSDEMNKLFIVEQLARLGVADTCLDDISATEFFRKIIMLTRRASAQPNSKLIVVDSGKGGTGVTSLTAALGEIYVDKGKKVLLIDGDLESQDLSRFLQSRPFVNENLQLLLDGLRPISTDSLASCYQKVWEDEDRLFCMSPVAETDDIYSSKSQYTRNLLAALEVLDSCFDYIIIDLASLRSTLRTSLYRVADVLLFVINNDPASVFANLEVIRNARAHLSVAAKLYVIENMHDNKALNSEILSTEIISAARLSSESYFNFSLPKSLSASRWPASGATIYSQGSNLLRQKLLSLTEILDGCYNENSEEVNSSFLSYLFNKLIIKIKQFWQDKLSAKEEGKSRPKLLTQEKIIALPEDEIRIEKDLNSSYKSDEELLEDPKSLFTKAV